MSSIQYCITLDLKRDYHQVLVMKEGDVDSREIIITIVDNGKIFDITNHHIEFKWHKPDHTFVHDDCTEVDGKALIKCDEQMLLVGGIANCEVILYDLDNETVLSTMSFDISIRDSVVNNKDIESSTEFLSLSKLLFAANGMFNTLKKHIADTICHITGTERNNWNEAYNKRHTHDNKTVLDNITASYTTEEKDKLFGIEDNAEVNVQADWNVTDNTSDSYIKNKPSVYTKNEVDNKFSSLETSIDWKESVQTYDDIFTTYPEPQDGWTVNVKDTDYTYRYNGTQWVAISANAIPKATKNVDGLLTKEDYAKISDIENGAEVNQNAFSNVIVGATTIAAESKTDSLTLSAGSNVTITPDIINDKITISSVHPSINKSTDSTSTASPSSGGAFTTIDSVTRDDYGHVTKVNTKTVTLPKTSITVDSALSSTSTNPVQNKVINAALSGKASSTHSHNSTQVTMGDGHTAETNLGAIKGITSSLASTSTNYALSASAGKSLQDQVSTLNTNLNNKSDNGHTHDDRYYTEYEIDSKFNQINNVSAIILGGWGVLYKIGKIVVLHVDVNIGIDINMHTWDETIPDGYKPIWGVRASGDITFSSKRGGGSFCIFIDTKGIVTFVSHLEYDSSKGYYIYGAQVTWITS